MISLPHIILVAMQVIIVISYLDTHHTALRLNVFVSLRRRFFEIDEHMDTDIPHQIVHSAMILGTSYFGWSAFLSRSVSCQIFLKTIDHQRSIVRVCVPTIITDILRF